VQRHAGHPAPKLCEGCLAKLAHHNTETRRYTYTNELGNPLFHVIRLEPKDPSKSEKMPLPLSYGMDPSSATATPCWALKTYHATDNTPLLGTEDVSRYRQHSPALVQFKGAGGSSNTTRLDRRR
jgi:hypothetical protein